MTVWQSSAYAASSLQRRLPITSLEPEAAFLVRRVLLEAVGLGEFVAAKATKHDRHEVPALPEVDDQQHGARSHDRIAVRHLQLLEFQLDAEALRERKAAEDLHRVARIAVRIGFGLASTDTYARGE